ncbi:DNA methyltransferase, partial [Streptomyces sp. SID8016]|nr:DNA methyltransferase [Streptomyces sp. SID8016]
ERWFRLRAAAAAGLRTDGEVPDGLDAVGARGWTREWTSELLELITVLALVDGAAGRRKELAARLDAGPLIGPAELRSAGVLPAPARSRRPASVLGHQE